MVIGRLRVSFDFRRRASNFVLNCAALSVSVSISSFVPACLASTCRYAVEETVLPMCCISLTRVQSALDEIKQTYQLELCFQIWQFQSGFLGQVLMSESFEVSSAIFNIQHTSYSLKKNKNKI